MLPDGETAEHELAAIIDSGGPISLGKYMSISNTAYYASKDPLGQDGDFITAPEISQMFGEMVGIWLADLWLRKHSPDHCHYVELGPGRGTLAEDALRTMTRFGCNPEVHFVETSPVLKAMQEKLRNDATWHEQMDTLPENGPLMIVANEFFDALPIEQFVRTNAGWRRNMVARDRNKFIALPGTETVDYQISKSSKNFPAGTILESSPASADILAELTNRLAKQGGVLLIIDYGYDEPGTGSTLQAVKDHLPISPFESPGTSDLTAHVDFHSLANIARTRLMSVHGPTEQGQWLKAIGIDQRVTMLVNAVPEKTEALQTAHHRLTHIDEMGRLFRVMAATSMTWPEPEGFAYSDDEDAF